MRKIIVLRGLQASGKSTYARQWVSEDPKHRTRWNRDTLREMSQASYNPKLESIMHDLMEPYLEGALLSGYDVILDDTNLGAGALYKIKDFIDYFKGTFPDTELEVIKKDFFNVALEECIKRNKERGLTVPEVAVRSTYNKYKGVFDGTVDPWDKIMGDL